MTQDQPKTRVAVLYTRTATGGPGAVFAQTVRIQGAVWASGSQVRIRKAYSDVNVSGNIRRRPALDRMLRDLRRSPATCVLVDDRVRLGRNLAVCQAMEDEIRATGADIVCDRDGWRALRRRSRKGA
jgi:DNA invertase Pin-like site-specific DNA recombinase